MKYQDRVRNEKKKKKKDFSGYLILFSYNKKKKTTSTEMINIFAHHSYSYNTSKDSSALGKAAPSGVSCRLKFATSIISVN